MTNPRERWVGEDGLRYPSNAGADGHPCGQFGHAFAASGGGYSGHRNIKNIRADGSVIFAPMAPS